MDPPTTPPSGCPMAISEIHRCRRRRLENSAVRAVIAVSNPPIPRPVTMRQKDKLPIGVIAVDAAYSPVRLVNFNVEDVRVGQRIDFFENV